VVNLNLSIYIFLAIFIISQYICLEFSTKGGADMPISLTTLQIFDQYLTTYRTKDNSIASDSNNSNKKKCSRFATHDTSELEDVYTNIQWKNRFTPVYLTEPTPKSMAYAVYLKESAYGLRQTIDSLSEGEDDIFSLKSAYSDNDTLASVEYIPEDATSNTPKDFDLTVENFATPQINTGTYLESDKIVDMKPDSYSFDLLTNKLHYEIQFNINKDETNLDLQSKLSRLINDADIGVSAKVVDSGGYSALEITSQALGKPFKGEYHFNITDDKTSYTNGVVEYLGLNSSIKEATNATYSINGVEKSSYSNSFDVHGAYHVTLHPDYDTENKNTSANAHIGLVPDSESLANNIGTFVDGYNSFLNDIVDNEDDDGNSKLLSNDMKKFLESQSKSLSKYGITINDDSTMTYNKSDDITDSETIKSFGANLINKLFSITIDPMEYVNRSICAYSNPNVQYPNPYVTSIYSGMLFNAYT
jgi:flagellar hook-associated protein 2